MPFTKIKNTKRFNFKLDRNINSHKSGANTFTIGNTSTDTSITMTVREATAMRSFLNTYLTSNTNATDNTTAIDTGANTVTS